MIVRRKCRSVLTREEIAAITLHFSWALSCHPESVQLMRIADSRCNAFRQSNWKPSLINQKVLVHPINHHIDWQKKE
jgi:hypothetical protein